MAYPNSLTWSIVPQNDRDSSLRWIAALALAVALFPVFGSSVSVGIVGGAMIASFFLVVDPRRYLPLTAGESVITGVFVVFGLVTLAAALMSANPGKGVAAAASHLGFIAMLPLLPVLRYNCDDYWGRWFTSAVAIGGCFSGVAAVVAATMYRSLRVEALTGNPLIFAYLAGVMACLNGWLALESRGRAQLLHATATFSSLLAMALSGSRGPLVAFAVVAVAAVLWKIATASKDRFRLAVAVYGLVAGTAIAYVALVSFSTTQRAVDLLTGRFSTLGRIFGESTPGAIFDPNVDARRRMLDAGWQAFVDRPILGYGRQNFMDAVSQIAGGDPLPFTHLHNAFLTEAVASGVFGLIAFCAVLVLPIIAARRVQPWQGLAVVFTAFTALYGVTNIGFSHDIKVFSYGLFIIAFNALSLPRTVLSPNQAEKYCKYVQYRIEKSSYT